MALAVLVNLFAGVKFPTGDANRLKNEVAQSEIFKSFLPPGTPHDPVGHSVSALHEHMLALGSGSYDGIFGASLNTRWQRWILNGQFQYYLRTEEHLNANAGIDLPLRIQNNRFQVLPDSQIHCGLNWHF